MLAIISVAVLFMQTKNYGFSDGHYGWVSSHTLAQISHATPQNLFLGYALPIIQDTGDPDYVYFDRYPVFFSGLMNLALRIASPDLPSQIMFARVLMNLIFCVTLFICYLLLNLIFNAPILSLISVISTFSTTTILFYKDMVHFDQPALLAIFLLLLFISKFELHGQKKWLLPVALFASVSGRGYASIFVLGVWVLLRARPFRALRFKFFKNDLSVRALALSVLVSGSCLAFNIFQESKIRHVPIRETSIVKSAASRIGVTSFANLEQEKKARLSKAAVLQLEGLIFNSLPAVVGGPGETMQLFRSSAKKPLGIAALLLLMALLLYALPRQAVYTWKKLNSTEKKLGFVFLFGGLAWGLFMRKLTVFHQYTSMYLLPANLFIFYLAFKSLLAEQKRRQLLALFVSSLLFAIGIYATKVAHDSNSDILNQYTQDFENIRRALPSLGSKIYVEGGYREVLPGTPYVMGYYLSPHFLSPEEHAEYKVTTHSSFDSENLTPNNKYFFLIKNRL